MKTIDGTAFRFVRRHWVGSDIPADMVNAFTHAFLGSARGQALCVTIANRQLFRVTFRPFLRTLTESTNRFHK
jgi:hypothetical protein